MIPLALSNCTYNVERKFLRLCFNTIVCTSSWPERPSIYAQIHYIDSTPPMLFSSVSYKVSHRIPFHACWPYVFWSLYFTAGAVVIVLAPAGDDCVGFSGTWTSSKSSWETALIVNESGNKSLVGTLIHKTGDKLTDSHAECKQAKSSQGISN